MIEKMDNRNRILWVDLPKEFKTLDVCCPTCMCRYLWLYLNEIEAHTKHSDAEEEIEWAESNPGVNSAKLFTSLLMMILKNKLECLSLTSFFSQVQSLTLGSSTWNVLHMVKLQLSRLDCKGLTWTKNNLAYFTSMSVTKKKCFITLTLGYKVIKTY